MNEDTLHLLVKKYINGTASAHDEEQLLNWYRTKSEEETLWESSFPDEEDLVRRRMLANILKNTRPVTVPFYRKWYAIAATVLVVFTTGGLLYQRLAAPKIIKQQAYAAKPAATIKPGTNTATLTLANGSKIVLDSSPKGVLAQQGGITVKKTAGGQLVYDLSGREPGKTTAIGFNTLATARGQQYQVVLPDGSHVWLNAASSLKFPTAFTGSQRKVELTGEAYFEVAKNKEMPFTVDVNQSQVQVLGTHFNIMAYPEESSTNTTLLEGSVKVSKDNLSKLIVPGQQARVTKEIHVAEVNTDQVMAWKNGNFSFNDEDIHTLMNQIARWYDVDV
jgi:transmembrane sensor